ncbi:MAG: CotH kinase family protein [Clostridia bacterium]|nr:CotH kinase family protein [Clostridia bacterium]
MASSKRMNLICVLAIILCLAASALLPSGGAENGIAMAYESRLFDTGRVHTADISMDNWDEFIKTCQNEEYAACDVTIDGEKFKNVAIRAKGNTSLSSVSSMNSDRYSFKVEFDHYDDAFSYHGLDKLSLNNIIQDTTFMKDYLTYRMMNEFGAPAPLTSFVYITVNGEDWGLYLAVEGVEDSFLMRNWGKRHGELYKPDSMNMGGGRGNGRDFDMGNFENMFAGGNAPEGGLSFDPGAFQAPANRSDKAGGGFSFENMPDMSEGFSFENMPDMSKGFSFGGMGSNDVKLVYSGDEFENYSNIFESAKTNITDADKRRLIDALKRMNEGDMSSIDVENVIRYFVVHNFTVNDDSYTGTMIHNYYLYEENGVLSMIPWDYNLAYGTFMGGNASSSVNKDIDQPVSGGTGDRPMIAWIFENEEYTHKYHAYFEEFLNTVNAVGIIEDAEKLIAPYVEKDPTKFCTFEEFEKGVTALKTFVSLRTESVRNQLSGTGETVDASGLNTSDMGTMGGRKGGFQMPGMSFGGRTQPEKTASETDARNNRSDAPQTSESAAETPESASQTPGMPMGDMSGMPFGSMGAMPENGGQMPFGSMGGMPTGENQTPFGSMGEMPAGEFPMTFGNMGGMPTGESQMPFGNMGEMPSGGFSMPQMPSESSAPAVSPEPTEKPETEVPAKTAIPDNAEDKMEKAEASEADAQGIEPQTADKSKQAGKNRFDQSQRSTGGNRTNDFNFMNPSGANATAQTDTTPAVLLVASIAVLILSIAIALIIKH